MGQSLPELIIFFHDAILTALLTGLILSPVGLYLHLRRGLFLGAALPQLAGFGFVAAAAFTLPNWLASIAVLVVCACFFAIQPACEDSGLTLEARIGIGYVVAMAGTILILALTGAESHAAQLLLNGNVLAANCNDVHILTFFGLPLVGFLLLLRRRLMLVSLDSQMAKVIGINVWFYEGILFLGLGSAITLTLTAAGAMACFGFLLFPPLTALCLCNRVGYLFLIAPVAAAIGGLLGLIGALAWDLPAGPSMVIGLLLTWLTAMTSKKIFKF